MKNVLNRFLNHSLQSMRAKVYFLFLFFTFVILLAMFASQVWLFPTVFNIIKTREVVKAADMIKNNWNAPDLRDKIDKTVSEQGLLIIFSRSDFAYMHSAKGLAELQQDFMEFDFSGDIADELYRSKTGSVSMPIEKDDKRALMYITYAGRADDIKGYILIFSYLEPFGNTGSIITNQFFINASILLLLSSILSGFVVARISNPVIRISRSANKLISGEFNMRVKPSDSIEIQFLKQNLNAASAEIAKTENLRKDLMANVSHDLRTPLTMIKAYAEMIRDLSGGNPEKREKHLGVIIDETDRLNALVADILDLSKLQSGVAQTRQVNFDFSVHLSDIITRFSGLDGYNVLTEIEKGCLINADVTKLEQVVYNLINNALNFTGADGTVIVRLFTKPEKKNKIARFEVTDSGKGIPEEQIPLIWERYYKTDKSENHKRAVIGTGLGLSIVKSVLELHGFKYGVDSAVGKGSTFWFEFPVIEE